MSYRGILGDLEEAHERYGAAVAEQARKEELRQQPNVLLIEDFR